MSEILLLACNARYSHAALSLKCLRANLREHRQNSHIIEFTLQNDVMEAVYSVLDLKPRIVALSVYIWNVDFFRQFVETIKAVAPEILLVVGGPEIAEYHENAEDNLYKLPDCLIIGEGEGEFYEFCTKALAKEPFERIVHSKAVDFSKIELPYDEYSDEELKKRILYVESSRGCPYRCSFCLSANDKNMRYVDLDRFLAALEKLYSRGARQFKFLDRSLNADLQRALAILDFFDKKQDPSLALHFEMVPQHIPDSLFNALTRFPAACIQIEFGVQSLNPEVSRLIHRPLNKELLLSNLSRLRENSACHIHADLIAGLPAEDLQSFASGFDTLYKSGVQEIQLGILKRLKGSPLAKQADAFGLIFSQKSPYEILQTPHISFQDMQRISRMSRYWDKLVNSGNFVQSAKLICENGTDSNVFHNFMRFSDYVFAITATSQAIALTRWVELIFRYLCEILCMDAEAIALVILKDYLRARKEDIPKILRPHIPKDLKLSSLIIRKPSKKGRERQQKHKASTTE
ncbi:MAG: DUF4080 domain-containing protein [Bradymonadales bacterium]|jgi:radical SAM superfamily enzyme YgiQ (UPF0313 family)